MRNKKKAATLALLASLFLLTGTRGPNLPGSISGEQLARWSDRALEAESWALLRETLDRPWWIAWMTASRLDQVNAERSNRINRAVEMAGEPDAVSSRQASLDRSLMK